MPATGSRIMPRIMIRRLNLRVPWRIIPIFLAVLAALPASAGPASPRFAAPLPEITVPRATKSPILDGLGTDPAWSRATHIELHGYWSAPTQPSASRTRVSLLHDGQFLYIAFDCEDRDIIFTRTAHDDQTFRDDCVEIFIGAPDERLSDTACLEINAIGTLADYYYRHADWINLRYESHARVVASRQPAFSDLASDKHPLPGYRLEIAIPFRSLVSIVTLLDKNPGPPLPGRLRANFARWDRASTPSAPARFTIWSDPQFSMPHPHRPDRYGWLNLES
ncbi:hypothetical protein OPIT5_14475 [Opitutaceae bacterium TAV5]|nr:hypothetical protein OPIT5_14475 [Opitutaceae bacterium TAV5]